MELPNANIESLKCLGFQQQVHPYESLSLNLLLSVFPDFVAEVAATVVQPAITTLLFIYCLGSDI